MTGCRHHSDQDALAGRVVDRGDQHAHGRDHHHVGPEDVTGERVADARRPRSCRAAGERWTAPSAAPGVRGHTRESRAPPATGPSGPVGPAPRHDPPSARARGRQPGTDRNRLSRPPKTTPRLPARRATTRTGRKARRTRKRALLQQPAIRRSRSSADALRVAGATTSLQGQIRGYGHASILAAPPHHVVSRQYRPMRYSGTMAAGWLS